MPEVVTVYFDYLCPFAWRGAEVAQVVEARLGLRFVWRHFSLYQSNYEGDDSWQLWNEPIDALDDMGTKGLLPFLASCAARCQGEALHHTFRLNLLRSRHEQGQNFTLDTVRDVAASSGLHLPRFERDLANPECRTLLAREHSEAQALDVFGTPTFHFSSGHLAYFRIAQLPKTTEEAVGLFSDYRHMLETYPYLQTLKRPRPLRS